MVLTEIGNTVPQREVGKLTNPFENTDGHYIVLVNDEGQHSLWPVFADIPAGWSAVHGPDARSSCLDYIEQNWVDLRPKSLIRAVRGDGRETGPAI